eukprot:jgi/Mesvir1/5182/Mv15317-RA.1
MVTSLGIRSASQVRKFCREESARLSTISGGSEGNCTGLFHIQTIHNKALRSAVSLELCRRGWVYWDMRRPRPDSIPGIAECADTVPTLLYSRFEVPYDPERGLRGHIFDIYNSLPVNIKLTDKGNLYSNMVQRAAGVSPQCLDSVSAVLPRTFRLYDAEECKQFFSSELMKGEPRRDERTHGDPGPSTRDLSTVEGHSCPSVVEDVSMSADMQAVCQDAANETWWLVKVTQSNQSI